jgi:uncharacterized integral membrane protein
MRILTWVVRLAIFIFLLAFAAMNVEPVVLRFYFDLAWRVPLVALLLGFFAAGVLAGLAAVLGTLLRQRREIARLKRASSDHAPQAAAGAPPAVDA